jgi:hypothetical protein
VEGDFMARGMSDKTALLKILLIIVVLSGASPVWGTEQPKILLLPFHVPADNADQELQTFGDHVNKTLRTAVSRMSDSFKLEPESVVEQALQGKLFPENDKDAQNAALATGSDLVIYGFLSVADARYRLRGVMWDIRSGRMIVETDFKVPNIHELPGVLQFFVNAVNTRLQPTPRLPLYKTEPPYAAGSNPRFPTLVNLPKNTGPWRSPEIPSGLVSVDIGDMDGDGKNETVFVEESSITISRFEHGSLRPLTRFSEPPASYVSAEVDDIDGDGLAELILCYVTPTGIESSVIKYANRKLVVVARHPNVILKTVTEPGDHKRQVLVGQRIDGDDMFTGEMTRFHMENGEVKPAGKIMLPPGTLLLSYASGYLGKPERFLRVILNQDQRLMVFDEENRLLESLTDRLYGSGKKVRVSLKTGTREITLPGRILIADTRGDGAGELLLIKQSDSSSFVQALKWDGNQLAEKWKTVRSAGVISDFSIRDFKNEGVRSLVLLMVKPNLFLALTGPRTIVYAYDLTP